MDGARSDPIHREQHTLPASVQHRLRIRLADEAGVEVEEVIQPAVGLGFVNVPRHEQVGRVVVALASHEAGVEIGERRVEVAQAGGEDLEFLSAPALDQRQHGEVVDDLLAPAFAHGLHHAADPRAALRIGEGDAALRE